MCLLDGRQQPRAKTAPLRPWRHHQHPDQAGVTGDDAAHRAQQQVALHRLEHGRGADVLAHAVHGLLQRRDLPGLAGPRLRFEGDALQRLDGGRVVGMSGNDRRRRGECHGACSVVSMSGVG